MALQALIVWWALFMVSNMLVGASVAMLVKGGPFARRTVPPAAATFLFICGMTLLLFSGKQNLLQATITFVAGG